MVDFCGYASCARFLLVLVRLANGGGRGSGVIGMVWLLSVGWHKQPQYPKDKKLRVVHSRRKNENQMYVPFFI